MRNDKIYAKALYTWGKNPQILMAIEEMSELTKELTKYFRGKNNEKDIIEEMADVQIMIEQLRFMFDCMNQFNEAKKKKLTRLKETLKMGLIKDGERKEWENTV